MSFSRDTLKGLYSIKNAEKYVGNPTNIIFRSSYELKFMKWCDYTDSVLEWGSEEVVIPYISPIDNRIHRYFVDFYLKTKDKDGSIHKYLVEVKPAKYTKEPVPPSRKTRRFLTEVVNWAVNQAKWKYATEYCKDKGWKFIIITEKELGITQ